MERRKDTKNSKERDIFESFDCELSPYRLGVFALNSILILLMMWKPRS